MTRKQARKHDRICLAIVLIIGAVLMVHTAVATVRVLSCKLDAPVLCRLDAPDFDVARWGLADCLHQHQQVI